jgi:ATP-dependent Clp protease ATP-binding subunit ClpA
MDITLPNLTPRALAVLDAADTVSKDLGHDYVGCEHLLLALLDSERNVASSAFAEAGTKDSTKAALLAILGTTGYTVVTELKLDADGNPVTE